MTIRLLYFAALKEKMGKSEDTCNLMTGDTPSIVARRVLGFDSSLLFAVNDELVQPDYALAENDQLAFIPPMAGG